VTALSFLEAVQINENKICVQNVCFCKYVIELALLNGKIVREYVPSTIVMAALMLADSIYRTKTDIKQLRLSAKAQK
jgi:hypothetical protein